MSYSAAGFGGGAGRPCECPPVPPPWLCPKCDHLLAAAADAAAGDGGAAAAPRVNVASGTLMPRAAFFSHMGQNTGRSESANDRDTSNVRSQGAQL